jgi:hypothetical protein
LKTQKFPKLNTCSKNKVFVASNDHKLYTLCLKKTSDVYMTNNNYFNPHEFWAIYIARLSCDISDTSKQLFYIEKCINCYFSKPSTQAVEYYNKLLKKISLNEKMYFNDFYSVTKLFKTNVLEYVTI